MEKGDKHTENRNLIRMYKKADQNYASHLDAKKINEKINYKKLICRQKSHSILAVVC